jgi:DNA-binding transcriptional regulator YhcF (GntR family)
MATKLIVTEHFGTYKPGDEITDANEMAEALKINPSHVVRVPVHDNSPASPLTAS